jgi:hypothetical protein
MGNPEIVERRQEFLERRDADRVTTDSDRNRRAEHGTHAIQLDLPTGPVS